MLFAHAGESHDSTIEAAAHSAAPWYIAVPLFLIAVAALGYFVWIVSKKKMDTVLLVLSIALLVSGFTLFNVSAAISIIALTSGFIISCVLAFGGIINSE